MSRELPTSPLRRGLAVAALLSLTAGGLSACDLAESAGLSSDEDAARDGATSGSAEVAEVLPAKVSGNVRRGASAVPVDRRLRLRVENATIRSVRVTSPEGRVLGHRAEDDRSWRATSRLEPGTAYTVTVMAEQSDGTVVTRTSGFSTADLTLAEQTYASVAPLDGETVGVGMPVVVSFDLPVTDRAAFERHMSVTSTPRQAGSWRWLSDHEAHWRPKEYWQAGSEVSVDIDVNSIPAGNGIYGQESRTVDFRVGDAHIYTVDASTHQMQVRSNGELLRTIPITTGKAGFTTRSGIKVIMEKHDRKRMNSETVGISEGNPEYYDIDDVQYAMRLTHSGEFIHAAPWSVGSQGSANVSHGCTGLSTADAQWLYSITRRGDVVEYTGTDRPMTLDNGYGDWNAAFADYREGSALR